MWNPASLQQTEFPQHPQWSRFGIAPHHVDDIVASNLGYPVFANAESVKAFLDALFTGANRSDVFWWSAILRPVTIADGKDTFMYRFFTAHSQVCAESIPGTEPGLLQIEARMEGGQMKLSDVGFRIDNELLKRPNGKPTWIAFMTAIAVSHYRTVERAVGLELLRASKRIVDTKRSPALTHEAIEKLIMAELANFGICNRHPCALAILAMHAQKELLALASVPAARVRIIVPEDTVSFIEARHPAGAPYSDNGAHRVNWMTAPPIPTGVPDPQDRRARPRAAGIVEVPRHPDNATFLMGNVPLHSHVVMPRHDEGGNDGDRDAWLHNADTGTYMRVAFADLLDHCHRFQANGELERIDEIEETLQGGRGPAGEGTNRIPMHGVTTLDMFYTTYARGCGRGGNAPDQILRWGEMDEGYLPLGLQRQFGMVAAARIATACGGEAQLRDLEVLIDAALETVATVPNSQHVQYILQVMNDGGNNLPTEANPQGTVPYGLASYEALDKLYKMVVGGTWAEDKQGWYPTPLIKAVKTGFPTMRRLVKHLHKLHAASSSSEEALANLLFFPTTASIDAAPLLRMDPALAMQSDAFKNDVPMDDEDPFSLNGLNVGAFWQNWTAVAGGILQGVRDIETVFPDTPHSPLAKKGWEVAMRARVVPNYSNYTLLGRLTHLCADGGAAETRAEEWGQLLLVTAQVTYEQIRQWQGAGWLCPFTYVLARPWKVYSASHALAGSADGVGIVANGVVNLGIDQMARTNDTYLTMRFSHGVQARGREVLAIRNHTIVDYVRGGNLEFMTRDNKCNSFYALPCANAEGRGSLWVEIAPYNTADEVASGMMTYTGYPLAYAWLLAMSEETPAKRLPGKSSMKATNPVATAMCARGRFHDFHANSKNSNGAGNPGDVDSETPVTFISLQESYYVANGAGAKVEVKGREPFGFHREFDPSHFRHETQLRFKERGERS